MAWRTVVGLECHKRAEISGELKYSSPSFISRLKVKRITWYHPLQVFLLQGRGPNIFSNFQVTGIVLNYWLYDVTFTSYQVPTTYSRTTIYNLENVVRISSSNNSNFYFAVMSVCHRLGDPTVSGSLLVRCQLLGICEPHFLFCTGNVLHGVHFAVLWRKIIKKAQTRGINKKDEILISWPFEEWIKRFRAS